MCRSKEQLITEEYLYNISGHAGADFIGCVWSDETFLEWGYTVEPHLLHL